MKGFVTLDVETTIHSLMGRKASVFSPANFVVAAAYAVGKDAVKGWYFGKDALGSVGWFAKLIEQHDPAYIVGFNIKFDILWLVRHAVDYGAYQNWIARGGQLWDTQLVEYLLEGQRQESHMLSLDEVAPRYGGTLKIDEVKAMWQVGINTDDIPEQLLMDYLVGRGDDMGDIGNTRAIFLGQVEAAKKAGQVKSIQLNNGALVATIEMERNGLFIDKEAGLKQAAKLKAQSISLTESLKTSLPTDLPFEFKWSSRRMLSALIFGGQVPYKQRVHQTDGTGELLYSMKDAEAWIMEDGTLAEKRDGDSAPQGVLLYSGGMKKGLPKTKKIKAPDLERPKLLWETFHYRFSGHTKPKPEWQGADKGVYSTAQAVIDDLGGRGIPFLDDFADLKDIIKDLGTYYIAEEEDDEGVVKATGGMLTLVHDDGLVHASINMVSTVTARFAHSKPNI